MDAESAVSLGYPALRTIAKLLGDIADDLGNSELYGIMFMLDAIADTFEKSLNFEQDNLPN